MKKFLLVLLLSAFAGVASAAIAVVSEARDPGTENTNGTTDAVALTPAGGASAGNLVIAVIGARNSSIVAFSFDDEGGQNWKRSARQNGTPASASQYWFWCIFNGSWSGDGTLNWTVDTSGGGAEGALFIYSGVDSNWPWDNYPVQSTQSSSTTWASSNYSTLVTNTVAIMFGVSQDDNTWTADNSFVAPVSALYWRCTTESDMSLFYGQKAVATVTTVGVTTFTQATFGADGGTVAWGSIRPSGSVRRGLLM